MWVYVRFRQPPTVGCCIDRWDHISPTLSDEAPRPSLLNLSLFPQVCLPRHCLSFSADRRTPGAFFPALDYPFVPLWNPMIGVQE